ncbi:hypothetical protein ABPG75_002786 [Micractinium tetrahymenae]
MDLSLQLSFLLGELALGHSSIDDITARAAAFSTAARQPAPEAEQLALRSALSSAGSQLALLSSQLSAALQSVVETGPGQGPGDAAGATATAAEDLLAKQLQAMLMLWESGAASAAGMASVAPADAFLSWLSCTLEAIRSLHAPLLKEGKPPPAACLLPLVALFYLFVGEARHVQG